MAKKDKQKKVEVNTVGADVNEVLKSKESKVKTVETPFDDETTSGPTMETPPVELDITNPAHGNLTYEELQAGVTNKHPERTWEETQELQAKKSKKDEA